MSARRWRRLAAAGAVAAAELAWGQVPAGQAARGAGYAARYAAACAGCHGSAGTSDTPSTPSLGGQPSFYAITQLFLFRDGRRNDHPLSAAMTAVAKGMDDADLRGYAEHIASLPPPGPVPGAAPDPARAARGRRLAEQHHCLACHGGQLDGGRQVPRLAHQREDYLRIALRGFRAGSRLGYTNAMGEALSGLSAQDLDDIAHFLAHPLAHPPVPSR